MLTMNICDENSLPLLRNSFRAEIISNVGNHLKFRVENASAELIDLVESLILGDIRVVTIFVATNGACTIYNHAVLNSFSGVVDGCLICEFVYSTISTMFNGQARPMGVSPFREELFELGSRFRYTPYNKRPVILVKYNWLREGF